MFVKELIEALQKIEGDLQVCMPDYGEDGRDGWYAAGSTVDNVTVGYPSKHAYRMVLLLGPSHEA